MLRTARRPVVGCHGAAAINATIGLAARRALMSLPAGGKRRRAAGGTPSLVAIHVAKRLTPIACYVKLIAGYGRGEAPVNGTTSRRGLSGKQVRDRQRLAHLVTGALLIVYVYLPGTPSPILEVAIRWAILPGVVIAGVLMWQWPKLRRWARRSNGKRLGTADR